MDLPKVFGITDDVSVFWLHLVYFSLWELLSDWGPP